MCHTAINALGGSSESKAFEGGMIPMQNWYAPSLTSNQRGRPRRLEHQGHHATCCRPASPTRGAVYGPMAEVVYNSLQYLTDDDVERDGGLPEERCPGQSAGARASRPVASSESSLLVELGKHDLRPRNARSATARRARAAPPHYPPLAGNQSITDGVAGQLDPHGAERRLSAGHRRNPRPYGMPPFAHILNDDEVAAVVTYIRVAWGNSGDAGAPAQANELRMLLPE